MQRRLNLLQKEHDKLKLSQKNNRSSVERRTSATTNESLNKLPFSSSLAFGSQMTQSKIGIPPIGLLNKSQTKLGGGGMFKQE
jgi:hypothetical protein